MEKESTIAACSYPLEASTSTKSGSGDSPAFASSELG